MVSCSCSLLLLLFFIGFYALLLILEIAVFIDSLYFFACNALYLDWCRCLYVCMCMCISWAGAHSLQLCHIKVRFSFFCVALCKKNRSIFRPTSVAMYVCKPCIDRTDSAIVAISMRCQQKIKQLQQQLAMLAKVMPRMCPAAFLHMHAAPAASQLTKHVAVGRCAAAMAYE